MADYIPNPWQILEPEPEDEQELVIYNDCVNFSVIKETLYVNPLFPNNFLMNIYNGILRYISATVPRRIKYNMITTYQKGIEKLHKEFLQGVDVYSKQFPSLILQPNMIKLDERVNNVWNTMSKLSEKVIRESYPPYASIGNLKLWVVPNRFTTTFEVFYIGESYPEILDMQLHMNRIFNNRYKYIKNISTSQIMLADDVVSKIEEMYGKNLFEISEDFQLMFHSAYNRTFYTIPWENNIHIRLVDVSDGSNYFGDTELPTYRVNFSFEAFFQLPNHLVLGYETDPTAILIDISMPYPTQDSSIDVATYLVSNNKEEVIILHIFDDYPEDIIISVSKNKINPDIFENFYVKITEIESGLETIITHEDNPDKFEYIISDNSVTFKLYGIEEGYIIDIIGKYKKELLKNDSDDESST